MSSGSNNHILEEEEPAVVTLNEQFHDFSRLADRKRDGTTITLYSSDYWLRQANIIDDRHVTMTDSGVAWQKFRKTELSFEEWYEFLTHLCSYKGLDQDSVEAALTTCGLAGSEPVSIPEYKNFFNTYTPKNALVNQTDS